MGNAYMTGPLKYGIADSSCTSCIAQENCLNISLIYNNAVCPALNT